MIPFLLFTLGGSLFLLLFHMEFGRRAYQQAFEEQVTSNASFFRTTNLPTSPTIASYLSRVLDSNVEFRHAYREYPPAPADKIQVSKSISDNTLLVITRDRPSAWSSLAKPQPAIALTAFWLSTLLLAYVVGRGLVRPILELNSGISDIDALESLPGDQRKDELGDLARTFKRTHEARSRAEKSGALAAVATSFAHEIKNPLAAAGMHLDLMDAPEKTAVITDQLRRIEQLVQQWQFLMRPEPPSTSPHDLRSLCEEAAKRTLPAASHADIELLLDVENRMVQVDGLRLSQVLDNLLMNAIQAMPEGGAIQIQSIPEGLQILDEGTGFDPSMMDQFGDLFVSTREGGMGIGLNVCQQIMHAHGGQLVLSNRHDRRGAEIQLHFNQETSTPT